MAAPSTALAGLALAAALLLAACATEGISKPAGTIGNDVAQFQGNLSSFQDQLNSGQDDQRSVISGTDARRDAAAAATRQMQVEWTITAARNANEIFAALQSQGKEAVTALLAPATTSSQPAAVSFPIDKLSAVSKSLDQLSKGQTTRAEAQSLIDYGVQVNQQLQTIENKAKSAPAKP